MKKSLCKYLTIIFCLLFSGLRSQTYSTFTGGAINDYATTDFSIFVFALSPSTIDTSNFGLETVCINLTHTWDADLEIYIVAPDGSQGMLTAGNGGSDDNYTNTCFNYYASTPITSAGAPFTGTFRPQGSMGIVNNGQNGNGIWKLRVVDTYQGDAGNLISCSITFGTNPAKVFPFHSSNLPIVVINTNGLTIPNEPKINAHMGIINNGYGNRNNITDPFNAYNGYCGIELRGSSSQMFPKKPYGIETRDSLGNQINVSLLGLPAENDWVFYASYNDKTLMRDVLTFDLFRKFGHYSVRTRYFELVLNGEYQGIYVLFEKIKRDHNRVNINPMDSTCISGDSVTGGYIFKIDKVNGSGGDGWTSNYPPAVSTSGQTTYFQYDYPAATDIAQQQKDYIKAFVDTFETVLSSNNFADTVNGYVKYIDVRSFIDQFIINEVSKQVDGYRLSNYLHKDRKSNGGKLFSGPIWDYDLGWWNADYCGGNDVTGWMYQFGNLCPGDGWQIPFWWQRLLQDTIFKNKLKCRYEYLRTTVLDTNYMFGFIDSLANYLDESKTRNFQKWPILGTYVWPNPSPIATDYPGEVNTLKKWIRDRLAWLDDSIPGHCYPNTSFIKEHDNYSRIRIYPNPSHDVFFYLDIPYPVYDNALIQVFDFTGKLAEQITISGHKDQPIAIKTPTLKGIYLVQFTCDQKEYTAKLIVE